MAASGVSFFQSLAVWRARQGMPEFSRAWGPPIARAVSICAMASTLTGCPILLGMPKFLKRRRGIARSSATRATPGARAEGGLATTVGDELERIEQEILDAESAWQARQRRIGRRWLPWMTPLLTAGGICFLLVLIAASTSPNGAVVMGIVSVAVNCTASYAIRKGAIVAPDRFPVVWRNRFGRRVNGANYVLLLAALAAVVAWMVIESRYL